MTDLISGMKNASPKKYGMHAQNINSEQPQQAQTKKKPVMSTTTKVLIGTGLTALAAAGIYIATKGKKALNPASVGSNNLVSQTIDNFKAIGKFVKGKAITNSGENFTGTLTKELKDGSQLVLDYKDGILQSSSKLKDGTKSFEKIFTYNENGVLTKVVKNDREIFNKTIGDNRIIVQGTKGAYVKNTQNNVMRVDTSSATGSSSYFYKDGKKVFVESYGNGMTGLGVYKPDGKTLDYGFDPKTHKFLAKDGTVIDELGIDGLGRIKENGWDRYIEKRTGYCVNPKHEGKIPEYSMPDQGSLDMRTGVDGGFVLKDSDMFGRYFENGQGALVGADGKKEMFYLYNEEMMVPLKGKHISNGFEVTLKRYDPEGVFRTYVDDLTDGKFHIYGKNNSFDAVFNSKTNTFDSINGISKEEAKGWLDKALDIRRQFRKDVAANRQVSAEQMELGARLDDLRKLL